MGAAETLSPASVACRARRRRGSPAAPTCLACSWAARVRWRRGLLRPLKPEAGRVWRSRGLLRPLLALGWQLEPGLALAGGCGGNRWVSCGPSALRIRGRLPVRMFPPGRVDPRGSSGTAGAHLLLLSSCAAEHLGRAFAPLIPILYHCLRIVSTRSSPRGVASSPPEAYVALDAYALSCFSYR